MFIDVVFPDGNEEGFIESAIQLGWGGLCFVYKYHKNEDYEEKIKKLQKKTKLKLHYGFLISQKDINGTKKTKNLIFIKSSGKNRQVIEKKKADVLFSLESQGRQDFIHHRASGLNHILCELAAKNNIVVGFSFNLLLRNKKNLHQILGRVMQNIRLCRKYKTKTMIASFAERPFEMRHVYDMVCLFRVLGMNKREISGSFNMPEMHLSLSDWRPGE